MLQQRVALPTHELAEAADVTLAGTIAALTQLEQRGAATATELPGGTRIWRAAA